MRYSNILTAVLLTALLLCASSGRQAAEDDFSEFEIDDEEFETDRPAETHKEEQGEDERPAGPSAMEEATVSDGDDLDEFDPVEFEHTPDGPAPDDGPGIAPLPPSHLRSRWEMFWLEILMASGLSVYLLNFLMGRSKNYKIAQNWFDLHRGLLESQFSTVGDDGTGAELTGGILMKESEHVYSLWCSGRVCCEGMLVELRLLKRQDLVHNIARIFRPVADKIHIKVNLTPGEADSFVMAAGTKKSLTHLHKELLDLANFCPERKKGENYGLPPSCQVLSEIHEATESVLDAKLQALFSRFDEGIEYVHVSDQYAGTRSALSAQENQGTAAVTNTGMLPEVEHVIELCFDLPPKTEDSQPLMQMVFHLIERVTRMRLSREAKAKADKNRQKVVDAALKAQHAQRQEAAQTRREDKIRADRDRLMAEEDPLRQNKLERRQQKKEQKKGGAKMKMMKVKM